MAQWGRNDQSATANSTTTTESSNGAPIGVQALVKGGLLSHSTNGHFGNTSPGSRASVDVALYTNTTPGAFIPNQITGIFGVSASEISNNVNNNSHEMPAHAGWVFRRAGTGSVINVDYTGTATGYNNTDVITVASPQAGGNATVNFTTNATGGALVFNIANAGAGFFVVNASSNVSIANSTGGATGGTGATFTATVGGRAGRVQTETLIAMGSLGTNTVTSTGSVGNANTVTDNTADNTEYPGL
jgi:hypothetical protein